MHIDLRKRHAAALTRFEYERLVATFDYTAFLEKSGADSRLFITYVDEGAVYLASESSRALVAAASFLMVMLGDAETNLLDFVDWPRGGRCIQVRFSKSEHKH